MGSNPSSFKGANRPVEKVSWSDCKEFISRLNSATGKTFRLPKEKEWEYAAKGGNKSHGYEYSGSNEINDVAWYDKNAYFCGSDKQNSSHPDYGTHNVKTKKPNELGLYDMSGNVWEWCEDLYDSSGSRRVLRGGGWGSSAWFCRVSRRDSSAPDNRGSSFGLRLAL
jgi:formylglycine-generating enzyme required for sulfatase activity